jgi:hypothetical protein
MALESPYEPVGMQDGTDNQTIYLCAFAEEHDSTEGEGWLIMKVIFRPWPMGLDTAV